ncbi:MAG: hypothetical protein INR71_11460, partial [Terriglobus roseus]|nr:hypothetical protein [Terriglobus roseus]
DDDDASAGAGMALLGFASPLADTSPLARTMAPVARDRISVDCTPGFWLRRVRCASASSDCPASIAAAVATAAAAAGAIG